LKRCEGASLPPDAPAHFAEPWQAQAFALAVALRDAGLFTADEWAQALGAERARPEAAADGSDYFADWLTALEGLVARKGVASSEDVSNLAQAWHRAAHATPHGQPIRLENDPLHG